MNAVIQYVQSVFGTMVRRGAKMSKKSVRWAYISLGFCIVLVPLFIVITMKYAAENDSKEYLGWALVGLMSAGFITLPPPIYGYHNRHRIDTSDIDEGYDFSHAHRAGVVAAGGAPLVRALFDWL